jgi:ribonuclease P protein component
MVSVLEWLPKMVAKFLLVEEPKAARFSALNIWLGASKAPLKYLHNRNLNTPCSKSDASFDKHHRLLTSSDFKFVFDNAPIRVSHPNILVLAKPNTCGCPRLGLVIAKKHVKKAVTRNKLKRLVRDSFRNGRKNLPEIDVIVLARKGADTLDNSDLLSILNGLWKRVNKKYSKIIRLESEHWDLPIRPWHTLSLASFAFISCVSAPCLGPTVDSNQRVLATRSKPLKKEEYCQLYF